MTQPDPTAPARGPAARALIEAKLRPPRLPARLLPRPPLARRLDAFDDRTVTLVAAPTGYGKTTALAAWAADRPRTAWLSLDASDDEPVRFARAIVAAIRRVEPDFGTVTGEQLDSPVADVSGAVRVALVNELEALAPPVTLIVDDLHVIRAPACQELVAGVVASAPRGLRLVVAARSDPGLPLGRLRAAGHLGEIRAAELRFDAAEADALLNATLGLGVPADAVDRLTARTEGWAAGLVLAAMSAEAAPDPTRFVAGFSGSDRNVVDYLAEEVLAGMPPETRRFLLATSVVEEVTGDLGDALSGTQGGAARLDDLARSNAFVVRLEGDGRWYRYHRLFREVLLTELGASGPAERERLLGLAAGWYAANGLVEQAARAALAAGDQVRAAAILATAARELTRRGDVAVLRLLLGQLDPVAVGPMRSAVAVTGAILAGLAGEPLGVIEADLDAAEAAGPLAAHPFDLPDLTAARAFADAAFVDGDVGRQARAAALLRERYPDHPVMTRLGQAAGVNAAFFAGDAARARDEAAAFGLELQPAFLVLSIVVLSVAALVALDAGDGAMGETLARRAHDAVVAAHLADAQAAGLANVALGSALAARGLHTAAMPVLERSLALRRRNAGVPRAHALLALAPVRAALGEPALARALVAEARAIIVRCADPGALPAWLARVEAGLRGPRADVGGTPTEAQLRVLRLLAGDLSSRAIARELYLSHDTVKSHTRALYRTLGVATRAEAVARARELGLLAKA